VPPPAVTGLALAQFKGRVTASSVAVIKATEVILAG
jgi:hypothetical protein